jgi:hypothetical protein
MYVSRVIADELKGAPCIEIGRVDADLFDEFGTLSAF